jgi:hypothetical protein
MTDECVLREVNYLRRLNAELLQACRLLVPCVSHKCKPDELRQVAEVIERAELAEGKS